MEERLQRIIARAGLASRRAAEELISAGRVRVNGRVVTELGAKADPQVDKVEVDGKRLVAEVPVYVAVHKPRGVVSTLSDPEGRPTVADLLRRVPGRVFPVGRLDFATSGILLATNDGDFANGLLHPRKDVPKTYVVKVAGSMEQADLDRWRQGVDLEDGRTLPADVRLLRHEEGKTWIEVTLREGRNQQIRRMGEATGFHVMRLARISFAGISSEGLRPGDWRPLSTDELRQLRVDYGVPKRVRHATEELTAAARRAALDTAKRDPRRSVSARPERAAAPERPGRGPSPAFAGRRAPAGRPARDPRDEAGIGDAPPRPARRRPDAPPGRGGFVGKRPRSEAPPEGRSPVGARRDAGDRGPDERRPRFGDRAEGRPAPPERPRRPARSADDAPFDRRARGPARRADDAPFDRRPRSRDDGAWGERGRPASRGPASRGDHPEQARRPRPSGRSADRGEAPPRVPGERRPSAPRREGASGRAPAGPSGGRRLGRSGPPRDGAAPERPFRRERPASGDRPPPRGARPAAPADRPPPRGARPGSPRPERPERPRGPAKRRG